MSDKEIRRLTGEFGSDSIRNPPNGKGLTYASNDRLVRRESRLAWDGVNGSAIGKAISVPSGDQAGSSSSP